MANDLFREHGFHNVTINEVAAAAGVHRATFLRYFATKEDAVVGAWDDLAGIVVDALRECPVGQDDWTALRQAFAACLQPVRQDPATFLSVSQVIQSSTALGARLLEKQSSWRPGMATALAERAGGPAPVTLEHEARVAASFGCLNVALRYWVASEGQSDLLDLLDEAFAALAVTMPAT